MIYHTLGRSGLEVSAISLGTGGPSRIGQRTHADESRSHQVIQRALDLGINLLDTAPAYGDSEAILGRALKGIDRKRYYLATKFTP
ncbi:MAG: aldo/keto reductase, partial [Pirellulaceae bacterium]|nr:aldo/keto reductase [Pirellulaceae bacterium]